MPNMSKQYQLILGTFIDNEFIWHDVDSFDTLEEGYKEFKKYVNSQLKYTDEELVKVWNSGRLDIELRRGNRLLNWVGIYVREVDKLSEDEEEKADEENPEKKSTKDSDDLHNHKYYITWFEHGKVNKDGPYEYDEVKKKLREKYEFERRNAPEIYPWGNAKYHIERDDRWKTRDSAPENSYYILHYSRYGLRPNGGPTDIDEFPSLKEAKAVLEEYKFQIEDLDAFYDADIDNDGMSLTITNATTGEVVELYSILDQEQFDKKSFTVDMPNKTKANDSDADFDHLIEWDTNQEWLNQLSPEDKEKLFTLGLNVKRHLTFHAFPETVRVNKDKNLVFPYNVPFDKWLKEKCTFFEGEW